jgi:hypothetical protein
MTQWFKDSMTALAHAACTDELLNANARMRGMEDAEHSTLSPRGKWLALAKPKSQSP